MRFIDMTGKGKAEAMKRDFVKRLPEMKINLSKLNDTLRALEDARECSEAKIGSAADRRDARRIREIRLEIANLERLVKEAE
jgi:hypothetical protein